MRRQRFAKCMVMLGSGMMLLQAGGCSFADFNELLQTVLLGVTAAGAVAILRNI